jgi:hypothetical protein
MTEPHAAQGPAGPSPTDGHHRTATRRLVYWSAVLIAMIVGLVVCWHDTAHAHDGVVLTVHTDGRGSVWADVAWEDGHPVGEAIVAAMTAQSQAGRQVGPVSLTALAGEGTVRYKGTLAAGRWAVTVDAAAPGTGTCKAEFVVGTAGKPQSKKCDAPPAFIPDSAAAQAPPEGGGSGRTLAFAAVGIGVVVAGGVGLLMLRERRSS